MEATFRRTEVPIETRDGKDTQEMDIIEISYPDGKVVAFPADMKSPETGLRYRDMYPGKYKAFKNGEPDPTRVAQLEREIAERQAELDGMRKAPDDERVQENLGYGEVKPDENPHDATKRLPGEPAAPFTGVVQGQPSGPISDSENPLPPYTPTGIEQPVVLGDGDAESRTLTANDLPPAKADGKAKEPA